MTFGGSEVGAAYLRIRPNAAGFEAETKASTSGALASIAKVGAAVGIVEFGKKSFDAYTQAQEAQEKFSFSVEKNGRVTAAQKASLEGLSNSLEKHTVFSHTDVLAGEAQLAQYKLTGSQLQTLTPLVADYAARTGKSLPDAAVAIGKAVLGQGRALKSVGIDFKNTGSEAGNYQEIVAGLTGHVQGFAEEQGKTAHGQMVEAEHQFKRLEEAAGSYVAKGIIAVVHGGQALNATWNHLTPAQQTYAKTFAGIAAGAPLAVRGAQLVGSGFTKLRGIVTTTSTEYGTAAHFRAAADQFSAEATTARVAESKALIEADALAAAGDTEGAAAAQANAAAQGEAAAASEARATAATAAAEEQTVTNTAISGGALAFGGLAIAAIPIAGIIHGITSSDQELAKETADVVNELENEKKSLGQIADQQAVDYIAKHKDAAKALREHGVSVDTLSKALQGDKTAQAEVTKAIVFQNGVSTSASFAYLRQAEANSKGADEAKRHAAAQRELTTEEKNAKGTTQSLAEQVAASNAKYDHRVAVLNEVYDAQEKLRNSEESAATAELDVGDAQAQLTDKVAAYQKLVAAGKANTAEGLQAKRDEERAYLGVASAVDASVQAQRQAAADKAHYDLNNPDKNGTRATNDYIYVLKQEAAHLTGPTQAALLAYIATLDKIPRTIPVQITTTINAVPDLRVTTSAGAGRKIRDAGGPVKAGVAYARLDAKREYFVPARDGHIYTESQFQRMVAGLPTGQPTTSTSAPSGPGPRSAPLVGVLNVTAHDEAAAMREGMRELGFLLHRQLVSSGATT